MAPAGAVGARHNSWPAALDVGTINPRRACTSVNSVSIREAMTSSPSNTGSIASVVAVLIMLTNHAATAAVTVPTNAIPVTIRMPAVSRPITVTGNLSPYPTVVTVVAAHQIPSPKDLMLPVGADFSASYTTAAEVSMIKMAAETM